MSTILPSPSSAESIAFVSSQTDTFCGGCAEVPVKALIINARPDTLFDAGNNMRPFRAGGAVIRYRIKIFLFAQNYRFYLDN